MSRPRERDPRGPGEGATYRREGIRFRAPVLTPRFPSEVPFGFVGRLLPTTEPIELRLEAHRLSTGEALRLLHGARAVVEAELAHGATEIGPELDAERASAEELGRALARRTQELWRVGAVWIANGLSRPRAEAVRLRLIERLQGLGFRARIPRYEVAEAVRPASLTGAEPRPTGYWQTLPTDGVAALFPFADETIVEPGGVLVGLGLADASPVFLDRWAHGSYSWGIFGATGAGKSFTAGLLVLRSLWTRPETEVVVLDPLGEYGALVRALGGEVIDLAAGRSGRLNPLDPVTTGGDRREKAARVAAMLRALFPSLLDEEAAALDAAVHGLMADRDRVPTLADLVRRVTEGPGAGGRLAALLAVFASGSLAYLDGPTTIHPTAPLVAVSFRGVPADQLPFHLAYVLDWAYGRLRDRPGPKLLVIDEAHLLARHRPTAEFLDRTVRHVRHFDAGVIVVSQSPEDLLLEPSGRSLLRNLYAVALLRLPEVSNEARAFLGLSGAEAEWLPKARLPKECGYAESLWRIGDLHLPLAIVASTPEFQFLSAALGAGPVAGPDDAARSGSL